ncbi:hypothetical protein BDQ17DRAFT_1427058 [Cyathus striatus]|nr:hypothetical protein BDQ17DRAFT_1427058 [Cyathus striatus]
MSSLAQRLNDLALANSQGLLDDHDYRILRQSAFEHHSPDRLPPERPVIPIASRSGPSTPNPNPANPPSPATSSTRPKSSVASGVTNLFRRATGRRKPPPLSLQQSNDNAPATTTPLSPTRSIIPRILNKKPADPTSPSNLTFLRPPNRAHTPSHLDLHSPSSEPQADDGPLTAKQIRFTIDETRAELQRLMDSFDILETTTANRINHRGLQPPSLPPTPTSYDFSDQHDLHKRRPPPLLSSTRPNSSATNSDGISIRSGSSAFTSRSQSASTNNALSPEPRPSLFTLKRKNSVSSISTSHRGPSNSFSLSKSTGHLPLSMLPESESLDSPNPLAADPEIANVRLRRQKVIERYEARLEYLSAKLRGAELHEKLLRK